MLKKYFLENNDNETNIIWVGMRSGTCCRYTDRKERINGTEGIEDPFLI